MGPPELKPPLPRCEFFEDIKEGESFFAELSVPGQNVTGMVSDFNWLQSFENAVDPVHAGWLHYAHSGAQFEGTGTPVGAPDSFFDPYTIAARIRYEKTERGVMYYQKFEREGPDDTTFRAFMSVRAESADRLVRIITGIKQNGKLPFELTEEEKQRYPGDYEAQSSQDPITQHSEETLATSDKGVVMLRRRLRQMVADVEAGRDPQNVDRSEQGRRSVRSGYFTRRTYSANPHPAPASTADA